jgi:galactokinase
MPGIQAIQWALLTNQSDAQLQTLYGTQERRLEAEKKRFLSLAAKFTQTYPDQKEVAFFSSPGRTEVGGNHTDHNGGRVLAAAVDLDIIAVAAKRTDQVIHLTSEGYQPETISLDDLSVQDKEKFTSAALIRGVCARMKELGSAIGGFDAVLIIRVPKGSGLSSSAAYEVLIATILDHFYNQARMDEVLKAQICQYAENNYFGKPCGLMDQTTCAVGGFVTIDFQDFTHPLVKKVNLDFSHQGYTLVIIDTGGSHADLTEHYAAVKNEMQSIASFFGGKVLREVSLEKVLQNLPALREQAGDRAILRAIHFFQDDQRVVEQVKALEAQDMPRFLQLVNESGNSSWKLLQNCYTPADVRVQSITLGLALSQVFMQGSSGACRVHGGGFAGTIQVFVPEQLLENYLQQMRFVFGSQACQVLQIRQVGATAINF